MTKISSIDSVQTLVQLAELKGVRNVVMSPGSRNAPLILSFTANEYFNCHSVLDERSAGFIALGMSQASGEPTILSCTSGSAVANYVPAVVEAFYQHIPLIVITADRPKHLIDQGEGQSMRQEFFMDGHTVGSYNLVQEQGDEDAQYNERLINEAFERAANLSGPVHINIPLAEPLYETVDQPTRSPRDIKMLSPKARLGEDALTSLESIYSDSKNVLVLVSQHGGIAGLQEALVQFGNQKKVAVLTETTSNVGDLGFVSCIDRTLEIFLDRDNEVDFVPDLLMTIGENIVSKKIKNLFRKHKARVNHHWHFGAEMRDTFQCLTELISADPAATLRGLDKVKGHTSEFGMLWKNAFYQAENAHKEFLAGAPYSDLKVMELILDFIPDGTSLQMGNSSVVRYVQLFNQIRSIEYLGNRGVSGIEGCTSTAVGMSILLENTTVLISGDQAFRYDSNALSLKEDTKDLKIIVINNSGGNIFRIIPGPTDHHVSDEFIEKEDATSIKTLVEYHQCEYQEATDLESLENGLEWLMNTSTSTGAVLEVFTPRIDSPEVLKSYFSTIKGIGAQ